jgi:hypothetical protein
MYNKASSFTAGITVKITWYTSTGTLISTSNSHNGNVGLSNLFRDKPSWVVTAPSTAYYATITITLNDNSSYPSGFQLYVSGVQFEESADTTVTAWVGRSEGTISADKLVAGNIVSTNYSTTSGSKYDLDNGTIELGGSSSPKFSVDTDGEMTSTAGQIGGITIHSTGMHRTTELSGSIYGHIGMYSASDTAAIPYAKVGHGFRCVAYTGASAPYGTVASVDIGCDAFRLGANTGSAHINVSTNSSSGYAFYSNGIVRAIIQSTSNKHLKKNFKKVNTLSRLRRMKVDSWQFDEVKIKDKTYEEHVEKMLREKNVFPLRNIEEELNYKEEDTTHIGGVAQEFNRLFCNNKTDEEAINLSDMLGVTIRALQQLSDVVVKQSKRIGALEAKQ